jgi:hypothetical protein
MLSGNVLRSPPGERVCYTDICVLHDKVAFSLAERLLETDVYLHSTAVLRGVADLIGGGAQQLQ